MESLGDIVGLLVILAALLLLVRAARSSPKKKRNARSSLPVEKDLETGYGTAKVVQVIDGDTVIVVCHRRKTRVRLDSIDCPEEGQRWGDIAKYGLIKLIGGRKILLEEHGVDVHGRTLATVYIEDRETRSLTNVNERMVTLGHAWVSRMFYEHLPHDRRAKLNRLEKWARSRKVGLWRTADPIPPWKWRRDTSE